MINFAVRADAVRLCLPYICTEETRYYLNGVCFEPGPDGKGVLAVATDGHKLGVAYDEQGVFVDGGGKRPIVRREALMVSALAPKKDDNVRWLVVRDQVALVVIAGSAEEALDLEPLTERTKAVACGVLIDGMFPAWRGAVPRKGEDDGWPAFNARYLKAISDGYAKVAGKNPAMMRLTSTGASGAALINFAAGNPDLPEFFAMLMPMKWDERKAADRPEWLGLPEVEKAAAA